jgi:hypothetical protein
VLCVAVIFGISHTTAEGSVMSVIFTVIFFTIGVTHYAAFSATQDKYMTLDKYGGDELTKQQLLLTKCRNNFDEAKKEIETHRGIEAHLERAMEVKEASIGSAVEQALSELAARSKRACEACERDLQLSSQVKAEALRKLIEQRVSMEKCLFLATGEHVKKVSQKLGDAETKRSRIVPFKKTTVYKRHDENITAQATKLQQLSEEIVVLQQQAQQPAKTRYAFFFEQDIKRAGKADFVE